MAGEVVHDDDVARAQFWDEHLGDIGLEGIAVDRPVEHPRRDEAAQGERRRRRSSFSSDRAGRPILQPLAARTSAMTARHVGRGPGLVDEDEALGIEVELAVEPLLPPLQDVGAVLFARVRGLFLRVIACRSKNRQSVPKPKAQPLRFKRGPELAERDRHGWPQHHPGSSRHVRLDADAERRSPPSGPGRASPCSRSSLRQRLTLAALTPNRSAASRCVAQRDRSQHPNPKIDRQRFRHACRPPSGRQCESAPR